MLISIRLEEFLETELRLHLQHEGVALSEFVHEAISEKLAKERHTISPYELGQDLFGRYARGDNQRSVKRKRIIREKIHASHRG